VSDADLEAWIRVRRAVVPNEPAGTVEPLRAQGRPVRLGYVYRDESVTMLAPLPLPLPLPLP
jgi:hypothetical protein